MYVKYLIFAIGNRKYAIDLVHVNGTEQGYSIIPVPEAPRGIEGLINLRGKVVPVYSLRARFGMDTRIDNPGKSLIIARASGIVIAFEVDEVFHINEVPDDTIKEMPQMASNDETSFMNKVIRLGREIIVVVDVNEVLSEEEIESLKRMIEDREKEKEEEKRATEIASDDEEEETQTEEDE